MCFIKSIIACLCQNMINFDAVDFSECHSEEVISFFWNHFLPFKSHTFFFFSFFFIFISPLLYNISPFLCSLPPLPVSLLSVLLQLSWSSKPVGGDWKWHCHPCLYGMQYSLQESWGLSDNRRNSFVNSFKNKFDANWGISMLLTAV